MNSNFSSSFPNYSNFTNTLNNPNMQNFDPYNSIKQNTPTQYNQSSDRVGFFGPFILGGITGGLLAPAFYPRPYYNSRPYYNNYYPYQYYRPY